MCSVAPFTPPIPSPNPSPICRCRHRRRLSLSPPTDNPLLRLDPQSSTRENVPPSWMSRDRPAANRRPLMSGRAPCRRLINRLELHRQRTGAAARTASGTNARLAVMVRFSDYRSHSEIILNYSL